MTPGVPTLDCLSVKQDIFEWCSNLRKRLLAFSYHSCNKASVLLGHGSLHLEITTEQGKRKAEILLPIKPVLQLFGVKVTFAQAWISAALPPTHTYSRICIIHNRTPTPCSMRNLLSVSTHHKVLRWHQAGHSSKGKQWDTLCKTL